MRFLLLFNLYEFVYIFPEKRVKSSLKINLFTMLFDALLLLLFWKRLVSSFLLPFAFFIYERFHVWFMGEKTKAEWAKSNVNEYLIAFARCIIRNLPADRCVKSCHVMSPIKISPLFVPFSGRRLDVGLKFKTPRVVIESNLNSWETSLKQSNHTIKSRFCVKEE